MGNEELTPRVDIRGGLLARNSLLNLLGQGASLLVGVLTIPFIVSGLGAERFGILTIAWVILGYFSIFDLGFGLATIKYVAEALGRGDEEDIPRLVWTSVSAQTALGVAGAVIMIIITPHVIGLLNIPAELAHEAELSFYLLALSIGIIMVTSSFRGVLEASQRFDLVNAVSIPSNALVYILPIFGLSIGLDLPGIIALVLISKLGTLLVYVILDFRLYPVLRRFAGSLSTLPRLVSFGSWITISSIAAPLLRYLDRFLIMVFLSVSAVAYYVVPFEVVSRLWIIPGSLVMTLFPAFSSLGTRRKRDIQQIYLRAMKYVLLCTGPLILVLIFFSNLIFKTWLGEDFASESGAVFQILLAGTLIALLAPVSGGLLQGLGRPDIICKLYLAYLPFNLVLAWFLIKSMGINGAALSFAIRSWIDALLLFLISAKLIRLDRAAIRKSMSGCLVSLSLLGLSLWLTSMVRDQAVTFGIVALEIAIFLFIVWRYVLDGPDRNAVFMLKSRIMRFGSANDGVG